MIILHLTLDDIILLIFLSLIAVLYIGAFIALRISEWKENRKDGKSSNQHTREG